MQLPRDFYRIARRQHRRVDKADVQQHGVDDEPPLTEAGKPVRHCPDHADGQRRARATEAQQRIDGKVVIRKERVRGQIEGGQLALAAVRRTRPVVSPAPPPTASTATPTSLLVATTLVTRDVATSQ